MDYQQDIIQANYHIAKKIYESANSLVYRGIIKLNKQPIILKILKENYPTPSELTRYKQEYETTRSLNSDGIIKAYDLQRYENSLVILLEDFGGESLKLLMGNRQFTLQEFLSIAIKITESLAAIHAANIIHKDINPSNIVYNPETEQLKIIDFGISTRLPGKNQAIYNIEQLEGTLAYIAPEQTGRMNRGIDYHSDFYSLGVTFYELLTNQLPFAIADPIELVHSHIAQQPVPPHEQVKTLNLTSATIPLPVSDIVMKLLRKTPEERYQSAGGIKADLENCLNRLQCFGQIDRFSLATQDICDYFHIPQKLYGREKEITQLLMAFEQVSQSSAELILVSGYSGIGKSALVNEIHKPMLRKRCYFIRGKFDQLKRDVPYGAIALAFQHLIQQLLSEPQAALQTWKQQLLEALEPNARVIMDVIPELEKIIGKQQPVEELGATEAQNRFNLFFQRFIRVFTKKEHPLVIFLDDLQWADLASLKLIELLITDIDSQYLLIIGAYRDNEVDATHPLMQALEQIEKEAGRLCNISLQPLEFQYINQLIADTLNCSLEDAKILAELINNKTQGNPFFLTQLLQYLYKEEFFLFDYNKKKWYWNIEEIEGVGISDNVVELTIRKITKLDKNTQNILQLAGCIGNQFNLEILSAVNNKYQMTTARELQPALESGLILPLSNDYKIPLLWNQEEISIGSLEISDAFIPKIPENITYKFLHDRVQQAAYALLSEAEKKAIHLQLGRLLIKKIKSFELEEEIFDIVNHLNEGYELIVDQSEKDDLAKLNLQASQKAKASTAYQIALKYLENALSLLAPNSWEQQYEFNLKINVETLELLYLNAKFDRIEKLSNTILEKTKNIIDKIKVYQIKILYYHTIFEMKAAINTAFEILSHLGIDIPDKNIFLNINDIIKQQKESIQLLLNNKNIEYLANLPVIKDEYKLGTIKILQQIVATTHATNFSLFVELILIQLNLCMKYGNSPQASSIYVTYGMLLCATQIDINHGYEFGKLSIKLSDKFNNLKSEIFVLQMYCGQVWHWKEHIKNVVIQEKLLNGFSKGVNAGEYEFASYAAINYCLIKFLGGESLSEVNRDYQKYTNLIQKIKQQFTLYSIKIFYNLTTILSKTNYDIPIIIGNSQEEENQYLQEWTEQNNEWLLLFAYFSKTLYFYLFKEYDSAFVNSTKAEKYKNSTSAYLTAPQHNLYFSLSCLAHYHNCTVEQQTLILEQVDKNQADMKLWASHCPANFQHKYDLVEAEKARVLEQYWQAQEFYEQAIQGAKKYEFIHEEALAYERAAEFYLALGREEIGKLYLRNAHQCYRIWGAKAKVKQLEAEYPQYLLRVTNKSKSKELSTTISTNGIDGEMLDLTTVIKASQAISGEIKLEQLLQNLMKIVIENAGAQKGFLIINHQGNWVIEAQGTIDSDKITTLQSIPIEFVDPEKSLTILPTTIINYVIRTQEYIVLNEAVCEGQFINDPYIIATQSKSILCTPLLNQGQLRGIVYLENNLTTGAFTSERVELLNILSAQAAISIDNSRLYQNLEQRVEERTKELSQTLDVLKATQAELIFENELLKSNEQPSTSFKYQVGGSLSINSPTYVVRSADRNLYKALKQGEFCYILNTRQMGKSSLMVRMMHYLQHEEFSCTAIDMTRIGSENITPEQWYKGFAVELWRSFGLPKKVNLKTWWNERKDISPVQRLSQFIEEVILIEIGKQDDDSLENIVIFIDEIDSILGLSFPVNDFFTMIRSCYNQRTINPEYQRLTFALFGVATPANLISDRRKTPFNIGRAIQLEGFNEREAQPLLHGFTEKVNNPQVLLKEVLAWTGGQPFLTQKLCHFIRNCADDIPINQEAQWIENLVQKMIIDNWESQDEPEHLKTIRDRILSGEQQPARLLEIYRRILQGEEVVAVDSPENRELLLSGLVVKEQGIIKVRNRIYAQIFDCNWIEAMLSSEHPTFYMTSQD